MFFKNSVASLRLFGIIRTPVRHRSDSRSASFGITVRDHRNTQSHYPLLFNNLGSSPN
jgi:hypothetical protein